ncbi:MAG: T9SS type A sorting domain-containing protein [Melioribacteraceae bacterium]|nr:T9SS type A sorting domain-containing protein [Melioribacteraceae bacterium]
MKNFLSFLTVMLLLTLTLQAQTVVGPITVAEDYGSFKGSVTVDLDGDGTEEMLVASWFTPDIYLLQDDGDLLKSTTLGQVDSSGGRVLRLLGAAVGDLNSDGYADFVFGARAESVPNNLLFRLAYKGGDITDPANYEITEIDSLLTPDGNDLDVIYVANMDGDSDDEIVYTSGYTRGNGDDTPAPMAILDRQSDGTFTRSAVIEPFHAGGYGNIIAGVDFDEDGKLEIYACSNNHIDRDEELVPKLWKFEHNGSEWELVFEYISAIPFQNTWPPLTYGDIDKDGKVEIVWCPINFTDANTNPNPNRIIIMEASGDDQLGVYDPFGGTTPNAAFQITDQDMVNTRPVRAFVNDIDNDGTDEIIIGDRASSSSDAHFYVISVDDVPDAGGGTETWTIEASGIGNSVLTGTGNKWDINILNGNIVLFAEGDIFKIIYNTTDVRQDVLSGVPSEYYLGQNYPNPFNPATTISFGLNKLTNVDLRVYDVLGREIAVLISNETMNAGSYEVDFSGSQLASGTYLYKLVTSDTQITRKMQLVK